MSTIPRTVYKVPNPLEDVSELYSIFADELPSANHPEKRYVVKEIHGYWDEQETDPKAKKFKNVATTLSPTDAEHCVTIEEAWKLIDGQIWLRAKSGFKYMRELDMFGPPHKLFEVIAKGSYRPMSLPEAS